MKTKTLLLFLIPLASLSVSGQAQVLEPQTPPVAEPAPANPGVTTTGGGEDKPFLGTDVPLFDPESEMFTWDGKSFNLNNNRLIRARFEKYLNAPEANSAEDQEYRETLRAIMDKLSPIHTRNGRLDLPGAVSLLPRASSYPIDSRLCDALAQAVYSAYSAQRNIAALSRINEDLSKEAKRLHWNSEFEGGAIAKSKETTQVRTGKNKTETSTKEYSSVGRSTDYALRMAEIEVLKKTNAAKMGVNQIQAKAEFQALILQHLAQRRFEHVIIGSRMYRALFSDGLTTIAVKQGSDVDKLFGEGLGSNPTLSTIESIANEVIRDVDESIDAFNYLIEAEEVESASKRLSEAFMIGEYLPKVRTLERDKKRRVLAFVRDAFQLKSAMEVRDYALARELVDRMRSEARDFDYSKARAGIEFYTRMSDAHIAKAKLAAQAGDMDAYQKELQVAIETWPQNPNIDELSTTVGSVTDTQIQAVNDFDRLISQKNHRQIFEDQIRYGAAVSEDAGRRKQLKDVVEGVLKIDTGLQQAGSLEQSGNPFGAWELVRILERDYGEDGKLSKANNRLTTQVAEFVKTLNKAEQLEKDGQVGSSLAWFLKAKQMYPNSSFAGEGIERTVDDILPGAPATASSESSDLGDLDF